MKDQEIFAYINHKSNEVHIAQHDKDSKNIGIKINKSKAEYAKRCQAKGLLRTNGSAHLYNSGLLVALMNSDIDDWTEYSHGIYDPSTINLTNLKKDLARNYEETGFKIITTMFKKSRTGESKGKYTQWATISANKPWPKFKEMCDKIFFGTGTTPEIPLVREVYHMVIHPDAIDYTKADVRDFFVNRGLLPK